MKKKIRDLKGSNDWLLHEGNRVRLTGGIFYFYDTHDVICVEHEMGVMYYETDDGSDAANIEVEVEPSSVSTCSTCEGRSTHPHRESGWST